MVETVKAGVGILVLKNNKVLLGKRNPDPEKADTELHTEGTWTCPGGKLHFGERIKEAAKREVTEETGLNTDKLELISVTNEIVHDTHFVTLGFLCKDFSGEPKTMEPDEIMKWEWFSLNKLPEPMHPPSLKLIKNYIDKEIYKGD